MHQQLQVSAYQHGLSISEEVERRVRESFDAETLEATLRRVVREEIATVMIVKARKPIAEDPANTMPLNFDDLGIEIAEPIAGMQ